jgi:hypothetical protein
MLFLISQSPTWIELLTLWYLERESSYDTAITCGILVSETFASIWRVVDAVHNLPEFAITYPNCHQTI